MYVSTTLVTDWTRRHARVWTGIAVYSAGWAVLVLVVLASARPSGSMLMVLLVVVALEVRISLYGVRTWRRMRGMHVRLDDAGFVGMNHRGEVTGQWIDVVNVEIDQSGARWGRLTQQQAVFVRMRDGQRLELEALRVDGLLPTSARKRAILKPYRNALAAAAAIQEG